LFYWILPISVAAFPAVFFLFFMTTVNYPVFPRYYDSFFILLFCVLALLVRKPIQNVLQAPAVLRAISALAIVTLFFGTFRTFPHYRRDFDQHLSHQIRWPLIYSFISEKSDDPKDCMFMLPLTDVRNWVPTMFVGEVAYLSTKDQNKLPKPYDHAISKFQSAGVAEATRDGKRCKKVFWIIPLNLSKHQQHVRDLEVINFLKYDFKETVIFVSESKNSLYLRYRTLALALIDRIKDTPEIGPLVVDLALAAMASKDFRTAELMAKNLEALNPGGIKSDGGESMDSFVARLKLLVATTKALQRTTN